ncbi:MAG: glutathione transferase GstA [Polyangiaceae bacterium]|nr:glutathione transferase GstA [Polyangiaceae bacterium]
MKLYCSPGACSLSTHIVARESGITLQLEKVDLQDKRTASGADFYQINSKGLVPALALDNGEILTEAPVIMQYLADLKPECGLVPAHGTFTRYRLQEMLGFLSSEVHKSYSPLFNPSTTDTVRSECKDRLHRHYAWLEKILARQPWLVGQRFTAADAYLFTLTNWANYFGIVLSEFIAISVFQQRVASRPHVQAALEAESLSRVAQDAAERLARAGGTAKRARAPE